MWKGWLGIGLVIVVKMCCKPPNRNKKRQQRKTRQKSSTCSSACPKTSTSLPCCAKSAPTTVVRISAPRLSDACSCLCRTALKSSTLPSRKYRPISPTWRTLPYWPWTLTLSNCSSQLWCSKIKLRRKTRKWLVVTSQLSSNRVALQSSRQHRSAHLSKHSKQLKLSRLLNRIAQINNKQTMVLLTTRQKKSNWKKGHLLQNSRKSQLRNSKQRRRIMSLVLALQRKRLLNHLRRRSASSALR